MSPPSPTTHTQPWHLELRSLELLACSMSPPPHIPNLDILSLEVLNYLPVQCPPPPHIPNLGILSLEALNYLPVQCPPPSPTTHTLPWPLEFRSLELFACSINYSRLHSLASHCLWVVETNHRSQYSTSLLSLFHINYCIHLYIGITNCLWYGIKGFSLMDTSSTSEVKWEPTHQQFNNRLWIKNGICCYMSLFYLIAKTR